MSLARTLMRFLFLAAIGHQVTYTVVEGGIFEDTRHRLGQLHPKVDELVRCHLCVGTWVGAMLAAVYRPNLLADVDDQRPGALRQAANLVGDAFLIALGSRVWNEGLGWLRREVEVKQKTLETTPTEQPADDDRPAFRGISIRPQRRDISES
jgi:hypothetical protein